MSLNGHKPLYQPWNEDEFMSSPAVNSMNWLQRLFYRSLLQKSFFCPTRPYLPDDDNELWQLAGCENKRQWVANKKRILLNFTKLYKSGRNLLKHNRVELDWDREIEYRTKLSEKQRDKANTRWEKERMPRQSRGNAVAMPHDATELNRTEQTELNRTEQDIDMSLKNNLTDKARLILGIRLNPNSNDWSEIKALGRIYDHHRIVDAFEIWAKTRRGEIVSYPLSEFLKVADGILGGIIDLSEDENLDKLLADLYQVADQAFAGKYKISVKEMVKRYGQEEVLAAYQEFVENLNEFQKSFAVRDFCEGGATGVIGARKNRNAAQLELEKLNQLTDGEVQRKAAQLQEEAKLREKESDQTLPL